MTYYTFLQNFLGDSGDLNYENGVFIFTVSEGGVGGKCTLVAIHDDFVIVNHAYSQCIPLNEFSVKYKKK